MSLLCSLSACKTRAIGQESPCLTEAGSLHITLRLVEFKHTVVPGQAAVLQQAPAPALLILYELLVGHMQHSPRQQRIPMRHDAVMVLDGARNLCTQTLTTLPADHLSSMLQLSETVQLTPSCFATHPVLCLKACAFHPQLCERTVLREAQSHQGFKIMESINALCSW